MRLSRRTAAVSLGVATMCGVIAATTGGTAAAAPVSWRQDFTADTAGFDLVIGQRNTGGAGTNFGTGELSNFQANNHSLIGGNLVITPSKRTDGRFTSTRLESTATYRAAPGGFMEVEGRLMIGDKGPRSMGVWPAFWMLGQGAWPAGGEIDLMENVGGGSGVFTTLHCDVNPGGLCTEPEGLHKNIEISPGFHVYKARLDRTTPGQEFLAFSLDGVEYQRITQAQFAGKPAVWTSLANNEYHMILNVAIGGSFPAQAGVTAADLDAITPGDLAGMTVDYVAVTAGP